MGWQWMKNMGQFPWAACDEEDMKDIPYPKIELGIHVTFKCVQAGTALGSILIAPIYGFVKPPKKKFGDLVPIAKKFGIRGAIIGLAIGPLLTLARVRSLNEMEIYDRCYRLRHNLNQMHVDRMTIYGTLFGFIFGRVGGIVAGIDIALIFATIRNRIIKQPWFPYDWVHVKSSHEISSDPMMELKHRSNKPHKD